MTRDPFEPAGRETVDPDEARAMRDGLRGFGAMVKMLRIDRGLTIAMVTQPLPYMTGPVLVEIEEGRQRADAEWIRFLAHSYNVSFTSLFDIWDRESPDQVGRMLVAEAAAMVQRRLGVGVECPCCGRPCRESKRSMSKPMARFLLWLVSEYRGNPIDPRPWTRHKDYGGDYAKIAHWGLATRLPGKEPRWYPTKKGRDFVMGKLKLQRRVVLWRNAVLRYEGPAVTIDEVLGEDLSDHLLRGTGTPSLPGLERGTLGS